MARTAGRLRVPAVVGATVVLVAGGAGVVVGATDAPGADHYDPPDLRTLSADVPAAAGGYRGEPPVRVSRAGDRAQPGPVARRTWDRGLVVRAEQLAQERRAERLAQARAERRAERRAEQRAEHRAERRAERREWVLPLARYTISAAYGESGYQWSSGYHTGLDFSAPEGTPLHAVAGGVVTTAGYSAKADWAGNLVVTRLPDGRQIWYAHQSRVAVSVGQTVKPGQVIGFVGSTGNSTGPHLHLEVQVRHKPVDPAAVLAAHDLRP